MQQSRHRTLFIPERKGKHRYNPGERDMMSKEVGYARGIYYHLSHPWHFMGTILNALAWMSVVIFMYLQNIK